MKWLEVQIMTTPQNEDIVSSILYNYGATGLVIEDPNDIIEYSNNDKDWDFIDSSLMELGLDGILIKAYYSLDKDTLVTIDLIKDEIQRYPLDRGEKPYGEINIVEVDDADWSDNWKKYFSTIVIADRIVIKPSWDAYEQKNGDIIIELDPGMAFGTGTHETTMMCAEALERHVKDTSTVFDIGCGSGILSIVAAKLGARKVTAIDLDPMCVKISNDNIEKNDVGGVVEVKLGNLLDVIYGKANIIAANIIAEIIVEMSNQLYNYLEHEGVFIGSGIIIEKIPLVKDALLENGFKIDEIKELNGWACIIATKKR